MAAIGLIFIATIMALFGVLGYQRGTKFGVIMLGLILAGLLAMSRGGGEIAQVVNGLNFGVRFVLSGGLQALGGGDQAAALNRVMEQMGTPAPLMSSEQPGGGLLLVLAVLVVMILLLSLAKLLKSAASLMGLLLGLFSGYLISAYMLAALIPEAAFMPLPIGVPGLTQAIGAATSAMPALSSEGDLAGKMTGLLTGLGGSPRLSVIIAVAIAAFVILATRRGSRGAKKG